MQTSIAVDHVCIKQTKNTFSKLQYLNLPVFVCTALRRTLLECVEAVWFFPGLL